MVELRVGFSGWLDKGAPEILSAAKDDSQRFCHPFASLRAGSERGEGSLADLGGSTRIVFIGPALNSLAHAAGVGYAFLIEPRTSR